MTVPGLVLCLFPDVADTRALFLPPFLLRSRSLIRSRPRPRSHLRYCPRFRVGFCVCVCLLHLLRQLYMRKSYHFYFASLMMFGVLKALFVFCFSYDARCTVLQGVDADDRARTAVLKVLPGRSTTRRRRIRTQLQGGDAVVRACSKIQFLGNVFTMSFDHLYEYSH